MEETQENIESHYTVWYQGYLFYGDNDGVNHHDYEKWDDVEELINCYGDLITVNDNYLGVTWHNGEWF